MGNSRFFPMGCAISEEDLNETQVQQDPALEKEHQAAGDNGFKQTLKTRKVLVIGRAEEDRRDKLMQNIVLCCGNGRKAEFIPIDRKNKNMVAVDHLPKLDSEAHRRKPTENLPVYTYETELRTVLTPGACKSLSKFVEGKFQAVILVIGASRITPPKDSTEEYSLALQDENSYSQALEELICHSVIGAVPVLVLINNISTLRIEGQADDDFNKMVRGICSEVKLALSLVEDKLSDIAVLGCDDGDQGTIADGASWLVRKLRNLEFKE